MAVVHAVWLPGDTGDAAGLLFWVEGLSGGELRARLGELGFDGPLQPAAAELWLPSAVETAANGARGKRTEAAAELALTRVAGVGGALGAVVVWLGRLAERDEPEMGGDLRFWAAASRWALDLIEHGRVVPTVERRADGDRQAVWRPALAGPDER